LLDLKLRNAWKPINRKKKYKVWWSEKLFPAAEEEKVNKKVVPFVKLVGPMENLRREDKENGLTFPNQCTWWKKRGREWGGGGGCF